MPNFSYIHIPKTGGRRRGYFIRILGKEGTIF
jgi:hypothetical protein